MIRELLRLGMDVARLNFSHSTHEEHARVMERLRRAAEKESRTLAILQDLQGPKIRTGRLKSRKVTLKPGARVTITPRDVPGTPSLISTSYSRLAQDVTAGARVLLSDGLIELRVKAIHGEDVECEVVNGGLLGEHQGINLPGTEVQVPALTEKDKKDLRFGLKHAVDLVAVSFVRRAEDVLAAKRFISDQGCATPVIAKLEKPQAIDRLEEILEVADGVMVARGDLGVEVAPEKVPVIQKHIIQRASEWRKPVITATQMLESMIENPRPTRAEASDVANAVFDGTRRGHALGRNRQRQVSARGRHHDGADHRRGGERPQPGWPAPAPAQRAAAFHRRDHLRIRGPRRPRRGDARHRRLHRDRHHGAPDLQVPSGGADLRFYRFPAGGQPA